MGRFFDELKRRNVVRVGLAYVVIGWIAFQIGEIVLPTFGAPEWVFKTLIFLIALGFPFVLLFAWAFEITPEGVKKTRDVSSATSITASTGRKLDFVIIGALVIALAYFILDRQPAETTPPVETVADDQVNEPQPATEANDEEPVRSIAVLPFDDLSPDSDHEWFGDGLAEEILNSLARTPDLLVSARTSSFVYKDSAKDVPTIATELGVEHILEGSVRRSDTRLRVTAQLIRASDGFHLWSETYDRDVADMIEIQESVAIAIARALQTAMDPEALASMVASGTHSIPAYEAYLEGLAFGVSSVTTGDIYEYVGALDAFELAVELDPEFAEGYLQLAYFWYGQINTANIEHGILEHSQEERLQRFNDAISNAIRLARNNALRKKYQVAQATIATNIRRALRLNTEYLEEYPNDRAAQGSQLELLNKLNLYDELRAALDDYAANGGYDPFLSGVIVQHSLPVGDPDFIERHALHAVDLRPDDVFIAYQAHRALLWVGDIDGASLLLPQIRASDFPETVRLLAEMRQACAENRHSDARRIFERNESEYADDTFQIWLGLTIEGAVDEANEIVRELDDAEDYRTLYDYVGYANFDPTPFPNLIKHLETQGAAERIVQALPYQCEFDEAL